MKGFEKIGALGRRYALQVRKNGRSLVRKAARGAVVAGGAIATGSAAFAQGGPTVTPPVDLSTYVTPFVAVVGAALGAVVVGTLGLKAMRITLRFFGLIG